MEMKELSLENEKIAQEHRNCKACILCKRHDKGWKNLINKKSTHGVLTKIIIIYYITGSHIRQGEKRKNENKM